MTLTNPNIIIIYLQESPIFHEQAKAWTTRSRAISRHLFLFTSSSLVEHTEISNAYRISGAARLILQVDVDTDRERTFWFTV